MIIKVCGMRDGQNIRQVEELDIDWMGMIFWPRSPRNVEMVSSHTGILPDRVPQEMKSESVPQSAKKKPLRVGVFVDEMAQNIITRAVNFKLDLIQMHGHETPTLIRNLRSTLDPDLCPGIRFIKAITIPDASASECREAIDGYKEYEDCVDYFLFDTKCKTAGGSGRQFDWSVLQNYDGSKPFLLSGGIGPDDAERVLDFHHPMLAGIDLNSRFETEPAMKDVDALRTFIAKIRKKNPFC